MDSRYEAMLLRLDLSEGRSTVGRRPSRAGYERLELPRPGAEREVVDRLNDLLRLHLIDRGVEQQDEEAYSATMVPVR